MPSSPEFDVGSVVELTSGGRPMNVTRMHPEDDGARNYDCTWLDDHGAVQTGTFDERNLRHYEHVDPPPPPPPKRNVALGPKNRVGVVRPRSRR
jgi:uncharacterized protein YodC (DUF2158 family)